MTVPVRRALASGAAVTLFLALTACGGNDDKAKDSSSSSGSSSSAASSSSGPSDGSSEAAGSGELTGEQFAGLLKDALDKATTAHLTLDLGSTGTAEGDADYTKNPPEAAIKMSMAELGGDVEVRMVDGTLYLKSASFGDKWVSASLDDPSSPLGALGSQLDITKTLQTFADAVVSASDKGSEDVDGDAAEHYQATVDTQKLLASLPSSAGAASLPKTMTQDWWFGDDGLIRKFSADLGGTATTVTLSDWGEDVSIEAPPSDEVTTMPGAGS